MKIIVEQQPILMGFLKGTGIKYSKFNFNTFVKKLDLKYFTETLSSGKKLFLLRFLLESHDIIITGNEKKGYQITTLNAQKAIETLNYCSQDVAIVEEEEEIKQNEHVQV